MPFFVGVLGNDSSPELAHFVTANRGLVIGPGWYLLPWSGAPDVLAQVIHKLVPRQTKVVITAVSDYWSVRN